MVQDEESYQNSKTLCNLSSQSSKNGEMLVKRSKIERFNDLDE